MKTKHRWLFFVENINVLLTVVFVALKLTGVVDWDWLVVLAPLWIGLTAVLLALLFLAGTYAVIRFMEWRKGAGKES